MIKEKIIKKYGEKIADSWGLLKMSAITDEELFRSFLKPLTIKTAIEIGTHQGISTVLLSQYAEKVYTFDITHYKLRKEIWDMFGIKNVTFCHIKDDKEKAKILKNLDFDFSFIDGRHFGIETDYELCKKSGRLLFHDYSHGHGAGNLRTHVVNFVDSLGDKVIRKEDPFAYWINKLNPSLLELKNYLKGKNIAILGNANTVLTTQKNINEFDVVIRMNFGYPKGKERYIGSRTDILALSIPLLPETIKKEYNPKYVVWMEWGRDKVTEYLMNNAYFYPINAWTNLHRELRWNKPSTGLMLLDFIVKNFNYKSITIYGFDFWKTNTWYREEKNMGRHLGSHKPEIEKKYILNNILTKRNIKLK